MASTTQEYEEDDYFEDEASEAGRKAPIAQHGTRGATHATNATSEEGSEYEEDDFVDEGSLAPSAPPPKPTTAAAPDSKDEGDDYDEDFEEVAVSTKASQASVKKRRSLEETGDEGQYDEDFEESAAATTGPAAPLQASGDGYEDDFEEAAGGPSKPTAAPRPAPATGPVEAPPHHQQQHSREQQVSHQEPTSAPAALQQVIKPASPAPGDRSGSVRAAPADEVRDAVVGGSLAAKHDHHKSETTPAANGGGSGLATERPVGGQQQQAEDITPDKAAAPAGRGGGEDEEEYGDDEEEFEAEEDGEKQEPHYQAINGRAATKAGEERSGAGQAAANKQPEQMKAKAEEEAGEQPRARATEGEEEEGGEYGQEGFDEEEGERPEEQKAVGQPVVEGHVGDHHDTRQPAAGAVVAMGEAEVEKPPAVEPVVAKKEGPDQHAKEDRGQGKLLVQQPAAFSKAPRRPPSPSVPEAGPAPQHQVAHARPVSGRGARQQSAQPRPKSSPAKRPHHHHTTPAASTQTATSPAPAAAQPVAAWQPDQRPPSPPPRRRPRPKSAPTGTTTSPGLDSSAANSRLRLIYLRRYSDVQPCSPGGSPAMAVGHAGPSAVPPPCPQCSSGCSRWRINDRAAAGAMRRLQRMTCAMHGLIEGKAGDRRASFMRQVEEALQVADDALAEELRALAHEAAMDRRRRARAKSHRVIELEAQRAAVARAKATTPKDRVRLATEVAALDDAIARQHAEDVEEARARAADRLKSGQARAFRRWQALRRRIMGDASSEQEQLDSRMGHAIRELHVRRRAAEDAIIRCDAMTAASRMLLYQSAVSRRADVMLTTSLFAHRAADQLGTLRLRPLSAPSPAGRRGAAAAVSSSASRPSSPGPPPRSAPAGDQRTNTARKVSKGKAGGVVKCSECKARGKGAEAVSLPFNSPLQSRRFEHLRFCGWECARAWSGRHLPVQLRHEVDTLIDITAGRLVGLRMPAVPRGADAPRMSAAAEVQ